MRVLITGGGGFLGSAIVRLLHEKGGFTIRSFSRSRHSLLDQWGVEQFSGDLTDRESLMRSADGCEAVIHVAALAGVWGRWRDYHAANVIGTENVISVCRSLGIRKLVLTSSPSVVHGDGDIENGNERLPYPRHYRAHYPRTKAMAERMVLAANGPDLATVALRPHLIWGPGDPHLVPRLVDRARRGKLKRIGIASKLVDTTFVDNAALAHVLALERLSIGSPIAGKTYFISNGEPRPLWDFINQILAVHGLPAVTRTVPVWLAKLVGNLLETVYGLLRLKTEPPLTRFVAEQLSTAHWYDLTAARRDLGYAPQVTIDEGLKRLRG